jgi:uncharacterized RDD family membrane protein YckC
VSDFQRRALAVALGQIRLVLADGRGAIAEQVYDVKGQPVGTPIVGSTYAGPMDPFLLNALEAALAVMLLLVMLGTLRKRETLQEAISRRDELDLAPVPLRFAAGVVDAFPMIIAVFILGRGGATGDMVRQRVSTLSPELLWLGGAFLFYVLHTTILELATGASIGKLLFGLRVATLSGQRPPPRAIVLRNVMRALDLLGFPLVLVVFSPLRQRVGDIAAGTLVVRASQRGRGKEQAKDGADRSDRDDTT